MPHSTRSSNPSAPCRLEWRPSRILAAGLCALGALAPLAVLASEMPRIAAWPLALAACAFGLHRAIGELRRPGRVILIAPGACRVDGEAAAAMVVAWRGPLAFLRWRAADGRQHRLAFWPDTLPAARRRELRLAASASPAARPGPSVAP